MSNSLIPSRLILRHSNVSGEKPGEDDLLLGEVFINIPDNKLYYRNRDLVNQIVEIELTTSNNLLHVRDVNLVDGNLIAVYSDNTSKPLGSVTGPEGRGLAIDGVVDYVNQLPTPLTSPPIANILNKNGTLFIVRLGTNSGSPFSPTGPRIYVYNTIAPHWSELVGATVAADGEDGVDGNTIISGTATTPNIGIGNNGDYYLDRINYVLFGPKSNGTWPSTGVSLRGPEGPIGPAGGPPGPVGPQGPQGIPGNDGLFSDPSGITGATAINNIVKISQTAFNNLGVNIDPDTTYLIFE
jgi:hypothetical protein